MALTVLQGKSNISVVFDGATDFDMADYCPLGVRLTAMRFYPSAANDIMVVREKTADGVHKWKVKDTTGGGVHYECHPHTSFPYIKHDDTDLTLAVPANAMFIFEFV